MKFNIKEEEITKFMESDQVVKDIIDINFKKENLHIKSIKDLDNKKIVYFIYKNELWISEFTMGKNRKYCFDKLKSTERPFLETLISTNKGDYFIICGSNYNMEINYRRVKIDNIIYNVEIPKVCDFIQIQSIERSRGNTVLSRMELYDIYDNNITNEVYKVYKRELEFIF